MKKSGVAISFKKCLIMSTQKTLSRNVVSSMITVQQNNLPITIDQIIQQQLITGKPEKVIKVMLMAIKQGHNLSFDEIATADIAGKSVMKAIEKLDDKHIVTINQSFTNRKDISFSIQIEVDYYYTFSALTFPETVKNNLVEDLIVSNVSNIIQLWTEPIDHDLFTIISQRIERTFKNDSIVAKIRVYKLNIS